MNYPGEYNKFMNNHASTTGGIMDKEGNYYYISHPPFAYILPHWVHKIVHVKPSVLSLQILNLFLNLISAIFIYLIVCLLLKQKPFKETSFAGVVGFSLYLFNPAVLWFQCNTYMSDMLVHVFFITTLYALINLIQTDQPVQKKQFIFFAFSLFLMQYTSWLGFLFAGVMMAFAFQKRKETIIFKHLLLTSALISLTSLSLILYQYIRIAGFDEFILQMTDRITERGGPGASSSAYFTNVWLGTKTILLNYMSSYLPLIGLILVLFVVLIKKERIQILKQNISKPFLIFSITPILILHFFLLNYSGHDFVCLYASLFLSVFAALLIHNMEMQKSPQKTVLYSAIVITIISSIALYYFVNTPGDVSLTNENYAKNKEIGQYIKDHVAIDEVVFYTGNYPIYPEIILYAGRNLMQVKDKHEALDFMKAHAFNKGFWFQIDEQGKISSQSFYYEKYLLDY